MLAPLRDPEPAGQPIGSTRRSGEAPSPLISRGTVERLRLYSARVMRSLTRGLQYNCCFMHIPKCAGTSMTNALRSVCPLHRRTGMILAKPTREAASILSGRSEWEIHEDGPLSSAIFAYREHLLLYYMANNAPLVCGHFLFSERAHDAYNDRYRFVSVLRDPLERLVSNYADARLANYVDMPFDAYLESDVGWRHATVMLRYFANMPEIPRDGTGTALSAARSNLAKFSLIGFTDQLTDFCGEFSNIFGVRLHVRHLRTAGFRKPEIDPATRRKMEALCAGDLEFYAYARRKFGP
jgi:hypothetical protein